MMKRRAFIQRVIAPIIMLMFALSCVGIYAPLRSDAAGSMTLTVQSVDDNKAAIANTTVSIFPVDLDGKKEIVTNAKGEGNFRLDPAMKYTITEKQVAGYYQVPSVTYSAPTDRSADQLVLTNKKALKALADRTVTISLQDKETDTGLTNMAFEVTRKDQSQKYLVRTGQDGKAILSGLPSGDYVINPQGTNNSDIFTPAKASFTLTDANSSNVTFMFFKNSPVVKNVKKDIYATKTWSDAADEKAGVIFQLSRHIAGGSPVAVGQKEVGSATHWQGVWTQMDSQDVNGNAYIYSVAEVGVPEGYQANAKGGDGSKENPFVIKNTKIAETEVYRTISGFKLWKGDKESDRPSKIEVRLVDQASGSIVAKQSVTKDNNWNYEFSNVLMKDKTGKEYTYRVEEVVPSGYQVSYDGYAIINTKVRTTTTNKTTTDARKNTAAKLTTAKKANPKTFVAGYGLEILAIGAVGSGIILMECRRRK